jgi:hypothetical protein
MLAATAAAEAMESKPHYQGVYLQLEGDCYERNNFYTGGATRNRTYKAYYDDGSAASGALITERVLLPSGAVPSNLDTGDSSRGVYADHVGMVNDAFHTGSVQTYQYFVVTIPGTPWVNVPAEVRTPSGTKWAFSIVASHWYDQQGNHFQVTYDGDAGMGGLPECGK